MSDSPLLHKLHGTLLSGCALLMVIGCGGGDASLGDAEPGIEIAGVGFMTPESVLADTIADVYLVSNINGGPADMDDNGFISRVSPEGEVLELKWIDGEHPQMTLNAPKGMAIRGDSLFVADIDCVRIYNRVTGLPAGRICVEGATFLNDVAVGPEGSLFVTDSGLRAGASGLEPSGTDAVYRLTVEEGRRGATLAKSADLGAPNGIAVGPRGIWVVTFGSGEIFALTATGERTQVVPRSNRQLDGLVFLPDGGFLFSSWRDSAVYRVAGEGGQPTKIISLPSPADIGFDPKRNRVLIPVFTEDRVVIRDLDPTNRQ
jgi:hypothetical protein